MTKNSCWNCSNAVGSDYCTMQKDMNVAKFKKCKSHKILPKKKLVFESKPKKRRIIIIDGKEEFSSEFEHFRRKGGHYSARTGKYGTHPSQFQ